MLFIEYLFGVCLVWYWFLICNWLVVVVVRVVVVVEVGLCSGVVNIVVWVWVLGWVVVVVFGLVIFLVLVGCYMLFCYGVELVIWVDDIVEFVGYIGELVGDELWFGVVFDVLSEVEC